MHHSFSAEESDRARRLLCALGDHIRDAIAHARAADASLDSAKISRESQADTIYQIDKISEDAIAIWFEKNWPAEWPVELIAEGLEGHPVTFPRGTPVAQTRWKCIVDPIDGTRGLMYDKRAAWVLAALAPQRGEGTMLSDLFVAAMTELPTTKQWRADQISAVRGCGVVAESVNVFDHTRAPLRLQPSRATDFHHGFASFVKFFPEGRVLTARIEERLWETLGVLGRAHSPPIFDDQYISTGGQFYELLAGHDRLIGDLRPLIHEAAGLDRSLACHPYDACTMLILGEAGVIIESPCGGAVDAPLDTTTPVAWIGFANASLASLARPALRSALAEILKR